MTAPQDERATDHGGGEEQEEAGGRRGGRLGRRQGQIKISNLTSLLLIAGKPTGLLLTHLSTGFRLPKITSNLPVVLHSTVLHTVCRTKSHILALLDHFQILS